MRGRPEKYRRRIRVPGYYLGDTLGVRARLIQTRGESSFYIFISIVLLTTMTAEMLHTHSRIIVKAPLKDLTRSPPTTIELRKTIR